MHVAGKAHVFLENSFVELTTKFPGTNDIHMHSDERTYLHAAGIFALIALVLQNTVLVLLMKFSYRAEAAEYSAAAAVLSSEVTKLLICIAQVFYSGGRSHVAEMVFSISSEAKLLIPCILYVIQNNLLYLAVNNLDTTVYVVCSQAKTLTSALFSYLLLGTVLRRQQVFALILLVMGISYTQTSENITYSKPRVENRFIGLLAVLGAAFTSGFAGVYLEKIYKDKSKTIWERNFLLSTFSLPFCLFPILWTKESSGKSIFDGFDWIVMLIVVLQACGGFVIAFVMRYANTLLKCFAVSVSVCLCMFISKIAQGQRIAMNHVLGVTLVNVSIYMYAGVLRMKK